VIATLLTFLSFTAKPEGFGGRDLQSRNGLIKIHTKNFMDALTQSENLHRFGKLVLADRALHDQLRATNDVFTFAELAVRLGAERGLVFDVATVQNAVQEKRREWLERWI
jgi:hypothetical protein